MNNYIYFLLIGVLLLSGSSCDDFLNEKSEIDVTNNNFWQNEKDLEAITFGMMNDLRTALVSSNMCYVHDRAPLVDFMKADIYEENCNEIEPDENGTYWHWLYNTVATANSIMENIYRADVTEDRYNFYLGQALFTRCYCYFYILRTWGDAPLILHSLDAGEKGRTSWLIIADQVEKDLRQVTRLLPGVTGLRDADGNEIRNKQYASRGSAHALLAHLYAWRGAVAREPELFRKGILEADTVIHCGDYWLAANPKEVCDVVMKGNSPEGIFELNYEGRDILNVISSGAHWGFLAQKWPVFPNTTPATKRSSIRISSNMAKGLYADLSDRRREEYFYKLDSMAGVSESITQGGAYVNKWRSPYTFVDGPFAGRTTGYSNNLMLMRLAGIILLRAEMKVKTGDQAGAISDVNTIRDRAGAPRYRVSEGNLKEVVARERDKELFLEPFIRYNDIVRNGTFREKLFGKFKTLTDQDVADGALFWPVHSNAFKNNSLMEQSSYWKRNGFDF